MQNCRSIWHLWNLRSLFSYWILWFLSPNFCFLLFNEFLKTLIPNCLKFLVSISTNTRGSSPSFRFLVPKHCTKLFKSSPSYRIASSWNKLLNSLIHNGFDKSALHQYVINCRKWNIYMLCIISISYLLIICFSSAFVHDWKSAWCLLNQFDNKTVNK